MGVKERILTVRLMERIRKKPAVAQALGIVAADGRNTQVRADASMPACSQS